MIVRNATLDDFPQMVVVEQESFGLEAWTAESLKEAFHEPLVLPLVAATDDNIVAGQILMRYVLDECEVLTIAVHPSYRRRGVGRLLLTDGIHRMVLLGIARCHLEVALDNTPARTLYSSLGFQPVGQRRGYYPGHIDALLMAMDIG